MSHAQADPLPEDHNELQRVAQHGNPLPQKDIPRMAVPIPQGDLPLLHDASRFNGSRRHTPPHHRWRITAVRGFDGYRPRSHSRQRRLPVINQPAIHRHRRNVTPATENHRVAVDDHRQE